MERSRAISYVKMELISSVMETETVSETLDMISILIWLIP
jgi:hypothetical protein